MKKFVLIILILLVIIFIGAVLYLIINKKQSPVEDNQNNQQVKIDKAKENILANTVETSEGGDVLVVDEPTYQIVYTKKDDQFLISISKTPFESIRKAAEEEFRKLAKSDREIVCKLNVVITTPAFANPSFAGKIFDLSFCQ